MVTALVAGEVNRMDGLADVVVGIAGLDGPQALVFEWPKGALRGEPEIISLPAEATALALGQLDLEYPIDLAVAAGNKLLIVHGRDRRLSSSPARRAEVPPATVEQRSFPFTIASIVVGDFTGSPWREIALLAEDGTVHLLEAGDRKVKALGEPSQSSPPGPRIGDWRLEAVFTMPQVRGLNARAAAPRLVKARVSSLPHDDLLVINGPSHQLHILIGGSVLDHQTGTSRSPVTLDALGEPVAVLPMRLNADALSDLVILQGGISNRPTVVETQAAQTYTVNKTGRSGDGNESDGICDTGHIHNEGPDGHTHTLTGICTFPAAIQQANANPGADEINFSIQGTIPVIRRANQTLEVTEAVTIIGCPTHCVELSGIDAVNGFESSGGGLIITGGDTTIRSLVINSFPGAGIGISGGDGNRIEDNYIGIDMAGAQAQPNGAGLSIQNSSTNVVSGNVISGNSQRGVTIGLGGFKTVTKENEVRNNLIGTDASGKNPLGNGYEGVFVFGSEFNVTSDNVIRNNVISDNARDQFQFIDGGVLISPADGTLIQGNKIGTDIDGKEPLGNGRRGVHVEGAPGTTIGGTQESFRNIISNNDGSGVLLFGFGAFVGGVRQPADYKVQGNFIGTDGTGTEPLGNGSADVEFIPGREHAGVEILTSKGNIIGGTTGTTLGGPCTGACNLISANLYGILIHDTPQPDLFGTGNEVLGNFIGTDHTGTVIDRDGAIGTQLGNEIHGIKIVGARGTTIGVTGDEGRNVISGNFEFGVAMLPIRFEDVPTHFPTGKIQGNLIGTDTSGEQPLGNGGGIHIEAHGIDIQENVVSASNTAFFLFASGNGVEILGNDNDLYRNRIGTDVNGTKDLGNEHHGVLIRGDRNCIGTLREFASGKCQTTELLDQPAQANVISGNGLNGVFIKEGTENIVLFNTIGTDLNHTKTIPNRDLGVLVNGSGKNDILQNTIAGNMKRGVHVEASTGNIIRQNSVGTDGTRKDLGNVLNGVAINDSEETLIGGPPAPGSAFKPNNVISGNGESGIEISGGEENVVLTNFIGLNQDGKSAIPNEGNGVLLKNTRSTLVKDNFISGNDSAGVRIIGGRSNILRGNSIGIEVPDIPQADVAKSVANDGPGVVIEQSVFNQIGVPTAAGENEGGNVISGNGGPGIVLGAELGADSNTVVNNLIGVDRTMKGPVLGPFSAFGEEGVVVNGNFNVIGGEPLQSSGQGIGNVISGNTGPGVLIQGGDSNKVIGNMIGTNLEGTSIEPGLGNKDTGAKVVGGRKTQILNNVIGGNRFSGVLLAGDTVQNTVENNTIGVTRDSNGECPFAGGETSIANGLDGVHVLGSAFDNTIRSNCIWLNGRDGVRVEGPDAIKNLISKNSIHANQGQGIKNLDGGNEELPPPQGELIGGSLVGTVCGDCTVEVFSDPDGQGKRFLTSTVANTNGNFTVPGVSVISPEDIITCTATDFKPTEICNNTSEFGCGTEVSPLPEGLEATKRDTDVDGGELLPGDLVEYSVQIIN